MKLIFVKMHRFIFTFLFTVFATQFVISAEFIPPGTVKANDSLYVDITEIRVLDWREYMYWNKKLYGAESDQYKQTIPDTTVWRTSFYEQVAKSYFNHPAYHEYPIVGISFEQAVKYCEWRSQRVNYMIYIKENKIPFQLTDDTTGIPQVYQYRLPTEVEWEAIANVGFSDKTQKKIYGKKNYNPCIYNLIYPKVEGKNAGNAMNLNVTAPVISYWHNALGCYNVIGNVAEMTAEKGLAKGGAWIHGVNEVPVERNFEYKGRQNWLGFRCVCEKVIKSEKELVADSIRMVKLQKQFVADSISQAKALEKAEIEAEKLLDKEEKKLEKESEKEEEEEDE